jgi:hypothetical protein
MEFRLQITANILNFQYVAICNNCLSMVLIVYTSTKINCR